MCLFFSSLMLGVESCLVRGPFLRRAGADYYCSRHNCLWCGVCQRMLGCARWSAGWCRRSAWLACWCCDQSAGEKFCQQTGPSADLRTVWQMVRERRPICHDFCLCSTFCWQNSVLPYFTITLILRRPFTKQGRKRITYVILRISVWAVLRYLRLRHR